MRECSTSEWNVVAWFDCSDHNTITKPDFIDWSKAMNTSINVVAIATMQNNSDLGDPDDIPDDMTDKLPPP